MIQRSIVQQIDKAFKLKPIVVLLGARQVGKSTLTEHWKQKQKPGILHLNGDEQDVREALSQTSSSQLKSLIGKNKVLIIDEAQRIPNIGLTLKLIADNIKTVRVLATGSSALELSGGINESLTGRKIELHLYPISTGELVVHTSKLEEKRMLENRLLYGMYPAIVTATDEKEWQLKNLVNDYLFKDLYALQDVRKPAVLDKLLKALALQMGSQVSYNELAQTVGSDKETVERYINLLEKTFVVFQLHSFSRNLRNELKKSKKVYFYDVGVRNAILNNFQPLSLRTDAGALWENFIVTERIKFHAYNNAFTNYYFWRSLQQQEIDLIEERKGKLIAIECKWNTKPRISFPKTFTDNYTAEEILMTPQNYQQHLI